MFPKKLGTATLHNNMRSSYRLQTSVLVGSRYMLVGLLPIILRAFFEKQANVKLLLSPPTHTQILKGFLAKKNIWPSSALERRKDKLNSHLLHCTKKVIKYGAITLKLLPEYQKMKSCVSYIKDPLILDVVVNCATILIGFCTIFPISTNCVLSRVIK